MTVHNRIGQNYKKNHILKKILSTETTRELNYWDIAPFNTENE